MALFNFDPTPHQLQSTPEPLPVGWYPAVMTESEIVPTSKGDGFRLKVLYEIIDGPGKGRKVPAGYNIDNPNPQAVQISMEEIKTARFCMGLFGPSQDSSEMHNKPLQIRLKKQKDSDYNEVGGYKTIDGTDADKIGQGAPMGHQVQPTQGFGQPPAQQFAQQPPPPPYAVADPTAGWQRSPDNAWKLNPATNGWEPNTAPAPAPPAPPAAPAAPPAWSPNAGAPAAPPQQSFAPPATPGAPPSAPAWSPQAGPSAPSWQPQR